VAAAVIEAMQSLDLDYPKVDAAKKQELAAARTALTRKSATPAPRRGG